MSDVGLRRYTSMVLAEAFGQEVRDDHGNVWVFYSCGPAAGRRPPDDGRRTTAAGGGRVT